MLISAHVLPPSMPWTLLECHGLLGTSLDLSPPLSTFVTRGFWLCLPHSTMTSSAHTEQAHTDHSSPCPASCEGANQGQFTGKAMKGTHQGAGHPLPLALPPTDMLGFSRLHAWLISEPGAQLLA